ncbi:glycosyltransferase family 2 protein [Trichocoleus sp. DQ-A3]|uniref:glycosyltransferase family A protein n=1 Tax=Cyanophyceae TaxID=3028117 RepID=UPI00168302C4|nr:glycosyltransferase family A protein [Coleofasciculus sp. FACHB-125]MBD1903543.1 glycosyltransferase family 2 protein [Coleofasciculus sp. FACHB-125]
MVDQVRQITVIEIACPYVFTVFTPTYNRAHTLHRVYESLKAQTYRDFEWLIIDDGSTDRTRELVEQWQKEVDFSIRYIYQRNAGKHIAFNRGVREAKGELFLNLDSDDGCVPEALERFKYYWDMIAESEKEKFSAVTCLCKSPNNQVIGSRYPFDPTDSDPLEIRYRFKVTGEKWGFQRTDILRQFSFPEELVKTYIPEGLVWNKIARKYKTRFVNEALRIYWTDQQSMVNYQHPSKNAVGGRMRHLAALNEEIIWFGYAPFNFFRSAVHYSRFSFYTETTIREQFQALNTALGKLLWLVAFPVGYLVYWQNRKK